MYDEFCIQQQERADAHLAKFLAANPKYSLQRDEPQWMKGTHLVRFGSFCGKPAVFKYYDGDPRKEHEKRALTLFGSTGLAPRIFGETDVMLIMERLPGSTVHEVEKHLNATERDELYFGLGEAVARVVQTAPGRDLATHNEVPFRASERRDFYSTPYEALTVLYRQADTMTFFDTTVARAAKVLRDRDVPHKEALTRSVNSLEGNRDALLAYPSFMHMDDFHTNNIMADGSRITGFIDLEMTRSGNEVFLIGTALASMCRRPEVWPSFRRGYEHARGLPMDDSLLALVRSVAPFSRWIRFTWYWSTDDLPWWAEEMDLRSSAVDEIMAALEAIGELEP